MHNLPVRPGSRLGILGGTFDPVHNGHIAVARTVLRHLGLDSILFVPAFLPPHKPSREISSFAHRAAMLELAVQGEAAFATSLLESQRRGPSYSIDTLRALASSLGPDVRLFFIIGMDAFAEISIWKDHSLLLDYASLVVVGRPDLCRHSCEQGVALSFPGAVFDPAAGCWQGPAAGAIYSVAMEPMPVSSSQVREAVRKGHAIADLVPQAVAAYIFRHGLYGAEKGKGGLRDEDVPVAEREPPFCAPGRKVRRRIPVSTEEER